MEAFRQKIERIKEKYLDGVTVVLLLQGVNYMTDLVKYQQLYVPF